MIKRILADVSLVVLFLFAPFWISIPLAVFYTFYFEVYIEAIVFGFVVDSIFGFGSERYIFGEYFLTMAFMILFVVVQFSRRWIFSGYSEEHYL